MRPSGRKWLVGQFEYRRGQVHVFGQCLPRFGKHTCRKMDQPPIKLTTTENWAPIFSSGRDLRCSMARASFWPGCGSGPACIGRACFGERSRDGDWGPSGMSKASLPRPRVQHFSQHWRCLGGAVGIRRTWWPRPCDFPKIARKFASRGRSFFNDILCLRRGGPHG